MAAIAFCFRGRAAENEDTRGDDEQHLDVFSYVRSSDESLKIIPFARDVPRPMKL